jgi:LAO/AO transport system kinase
MTGNIDLLKSEIVKGSRLSLAKAITLVESTRIDHRLEAESLLSQLISRTGRSIRVAISGPPGVGKSSFIEAMGLHLVRSGKSLAVLAIDPTSPLTGGSILGDKTRMEELSKSDRCFIRPSPSSGALGGVGRHTRETMLLCEAAGFSVVLIETVGIGQSEFVAASMTDIFVQLHQPFSGDELQGIKKGVMELADLVVVTKADGDSLSAADLAKKDLERAISLIKAHAEEKTEVVTVSSTKGISIASTWDKIEQIYQSRLKSGAISKKRTIQNREWLNQEILNALQDCLTTHPRYENLLQKTYDQVETSTEHCAKAARDLVTSLLRSVE